MTLDRLNSPGDRGDNDHKLLAGPALIDCPSSTGPPSGAQWWSTATRHSNMGAALFSQQQEILQSVVP